MSSGPFESSTWGRWRQAGVVARIRRRVLLSLGAVVAWVSLTLLYVAFWAHGFTLFQSVVVIVVSLLVLFAVVAGAWISFGLGFARRGFD
jgi:hypothetical protein